MSVSRGALLLDRSRELILVGYSVEDRCMLTPFVPHAEREHRGITLAKRAEYFTSDTYAWPGMIPKLVDKMPLDDNGNKFELIATSSGTLGSDTGVRNVGQLPRDKWLQEVARSKFMVSEMSAAVRLGDGLMYQLAVGKPFLSPSRKSTGPDIVRFQCSRSSV